MSRAYREATRGTRTRFALLVLAGLLVAALLPPWIRAYMADVELLPLCEKLRPLRAFIVGGYLACVVLAGLAANAAVRTLASGESPFPGAWIWRRTPIRTGWRAKADGVFHALVAFALVVGPLAVLDRLDAMVIFDVPADVVCR